MSNHSKSGKHPVLPIEIGDIEGVKDKSHHSLTAPQVAQVCSTATALAATAAAFFQPGSFQQQQQQQQQQRLSRAHQLPQDAQNQLDAAD
jgi:hypothetical protein